MILLRRAWQITYWVLPGKKLSRMPGTFLWYLKPGIKMQNIASSSRLKKSVPWLKIATFILAIIPLAALLLIILNLVLKSHLAVTTEGWKLFSTSFDAQKNFGLLPALWGTFLVTLLAMLIATPIALMLAIIATDFSFGFVSNIVRWTIGVLSGIPPIIYAMMSATFVDLFI